MIVMTEVISREDVKKTLNSLERDFLKYQKRITPLVLFIVLFFGFFLVRFFRAISVIAMWTSLTISILILTYWIVKYFVYKSTIRTVSLSAIHMLHADMMLKFKEKKIPMLPLSDSAQGSFSDVIDSRKAVLIYILFFVVILLNYIFF